MALPRKRLAILSLCFSLLAGIAFRLVAQEDKPLRLDVKLVNIFVNVTDKSGAIVGGLSKDDFKITEDNRPQTIANFERQSEMPLNLTLAIDTSSSTYKDRAIEQQAAKKFVHALLRPQDQMSLLEFDTFVSELTRGFTNKETEIDRGLEHMRGEGGTALYDAIYLGSKSLGKRDGRKILVLVTDGGDTVKGYTYDEAIEEALRNEVMIYSIIDVPIAASAGRDLGGEHALIQLSEDTGGKHFYVDAGGLDKAFAQVSADLRTQYLIGYYPRNQEPGKEFHHIQVTVPRAATESFNIRHKTGYYADPQKSRD
ncbi:VWA domain-containing protein [Telmatobacter sp. DSM 110680]|uniref:VWA domain-containing protein n=1 Tax=Telmatobacter sp. DSM 110680 TaxID=3036704 RepID=A0AAU7DIT9_9BACT